jgi:hypothetical protein
MAEVVKDKEIWVHSFRMPPDSNNSIKMEVGIEDCLHIEFEYNKSKYVARTFAPSLGWLTEIQISPEGRDCRENLFPTGQNQDQAHGALHHSTRDNGIAA